jgi:hypothetical protein
VEGNGRVFSVWLVYPLSIYLEGTGKSSSEDRSSSSRVSNLGHLNTELDSEATHEHVLSSPCPTTALM